MRPIIRRVPRSRCLSRTRAGQRCCHDASSVRRYPASARAVLAAESGLPGNLRTEARRGNGHRGALCRRSLTHGTDAGASHTSCATPFDTTDHMEPDEIATQHLGARFCETSTGSLYLSVAGPGRLVESGTELRTELAMATRGCSWIPLATRPLSDGRGFRAELHGLRHGLASHPAGGGGRSRRRLGTLGRVKVAVDDEHADRNDLDPESPDHGRRDSRELLAPNR